MTFDGYGKMLGGEVLSSGKIDFNNLQQTYEYLNLTISEYVLKNDLDVLFIEIPAAFFFRFIIKTEKTSRYSF